MNYKHIAISPQSFDQLDALASSWSMDKKEFVENMITYFRLTGDDPTATKKDNTVIAIKKLQTTLVCFIKTHETDHLVKIVTDFEETRKGLSEGQAKQSSAIKAEIESGRLEDKERLDAWMIHGMELPDGTDFSMQDQFKKVLAKEDEMVKLVKEITVKTEKKKGVMMGRLEAMEEGVTKWSAITKDGNKERATALIEELKTLVSGTY
jgi:hypothetical protein